MPTHLELLVENERLVSVERRAKFLILKTERFAFLSHLGMSGYWRFEREWIRSPHDHIAFEFVDGTFLVYQDPRRFGLFELLDRNGPHKHPWLAKLGAEPFERSWSGDALYDQVHTRHSPIKAVLLDQRVVSGLGNIYVSEVLFRVGLRPTRRASSLTRSHCKQIVQATRTVLKEAINKGGTTLRDYLRPDGKEGEMKSRLKVYGRDGEYCYQCTSGVIKKMVQGGRSTFYCRVCQK